MNPAGIYILSRIRALSPGAQAHWKPGFVVTLFYDKVSFRLLLERG